ncbi:protein of unknown function [Azospirillum lipoferum 4B]|uniref:Uncharacterized protein n=1 Tax=Azospirillum lipoferum (strain 4B) TaxID=862719 RepID=G7Z7B3_AZOL4|nr:protein of unknown function [Azospirillum lipoferum 4B]
MTGYPAWCRAACRGSASDWREATPPFGRRDRARHVPAAPESSTWARRAERLPRSNCREDMGWMCVRTCPSHRYASDEATRK